MNVTKVPINNSLFLLFRDGGRLRLCYDQFRKSIQIKVSLKQIPLNLDSKLYFGCSWHFGKILPHFLIRLFVSKCIQTGCDCCYIDGHGFTNDSLSKAAVSNPWPARKSSNNFILSYFMHLAVARIIIYWLELVFAICGPLPIAKSNNWHFGRKRLRTAGLKRQLRPRPVRQIPPRYYSDVPRRRCVKFPIFSRKSPKLRSCACDEVRNSWETLRVISFG